MLGPLSNIGNVNILNESLENTANFINDIRSGLIILNTDGSGNYWCVVKQYGLCTITANL